MLITTQKALTSLVSGIRNCTASSLSFFDGTRGSGNTSLGAVSFFSRPNEYFKDVFFFPFDIPNSKDNDDIANS